MECKKCGKNIAGNEFRKVADWCFCLECFQELMYEAEKKDDEKREDSSEETAALQQKVAGKGKCCVCSKELEVDEGRNLLGLSFCPDCYEVLVKRPAVQAPLENDEKEDAPRVAQVRVDLKKNVLCQGCNRQIPLLGSKELEGRFYCPDCYQALPEVQALKPKPFPVAGETPVGEVGPICQACAREVSFESLRTIEGFEICQSCLAVDPDGALKIARARHRTLMEEMKKKLGI